MNYKYIMIDVHIVHVCITGVSFRHTQSSLWQLYVYEQSANEVLF